MSEKDVSDLLRAGDPARALPRGGFAPRRARSVARTMRHPVLGWLWLHHRAAARAAAALVLALALVALFSVRPREKRTLPPVEVRVAAPETPPPEFQEDAEPRDFPEPPELPPPPEIPANGDAAP